MSAMPEILTDVREEGHTKKVGHNDAELNCEMFVSPQNLTEQRWRAKVILDLTAISENLNISKPLFLRSKYKTLFSTVSELKKQRNWIIHQYGLPQSQLNWKEMWSWSIPRLRMNYYHYWITPSRKKWRVHFSPQERKLNVGKWSEEISMFRNYNQGRRRWISSLNDKCSEMEGQRHIYLYKIEQGMNIDLNKIFTAFIVWVSVTLSKFRHPAVR